MKKQIRAVTEANSQQPCSHYVKERLYKEGKTFTELKEIKIETKQVGSDIAVDMVCGYDENNNLVFEWIRSAVNIEYYI